MHNAVPCGDFQEPGYEVRVSDCSTPRRRRKDSGSRMRHANVKPATKVGRGSIAGQIGHAISDLGTSHSYEECNAQEGQEELLREQKMRWSGYHDAADNGGPKSWGSAVEKDRAKPIRRLM